MAESGEVKCVLRSILIANPMKMTVGQLYNQFKDLEGYEVPYRQFGFPSFEHYLSTIPDTLQVIGMGPQAEVRAVVTKKTAHIVDMISKQKAPQKKPQKMGRYRQNFGFNYNMRPQPSRATPVFANQPPRPLMSIRPYGRGGLCAVPYNGNQGPPFKFYPLTPRQMGVPRHPTRNPYLHVADLHSAPSRRGDGRYNTDDRRENNEDLRYHLDDIRARKEDTVPVTPLKNEEDERCDPEDPPEAHGSSCRYLPEIPDSDSSYYEASEEGGCAVDDKREDTEPEDEGATALAPPDKLFMSDDEDDIIYKVPCEVQCNLKALIGEYPEGVWCSKMPEVYKSKFGKELNYLTYGYKSLIQMCADLSYIFAYRQADRGDFKLYDKRRPVPPEEFEVLKQFAEMQRQTPFEPRTTKPALPDDLNDILSGPNMYPEDVANLQDRIPRETVTEKEKDYVDILIAEIYDPSKFWFNLLRTANELDAVMDEMQMFYKENRTRYEIPSCLLQVGLYCAVFFQNEYQRARICNMMPKSPSSVKVFFIDYGTVSSVLMSKICYLHRSFMGFPAQAIRGRLARIYPPLVDQQWPRASATRFLNLVVQKKLIAEIDSIDVKKQIFDLIVADTTGDEDIFINDTLVYDGHALFIHQDRKAADTSSEYVPIVRYIHLFPTFEELELGLVPTAYEMIILNQTNIPFHIVYPQYFKKIRNDESVAATRTADYEEITPGNDEESKSADESALETKIYGVKEWLKNNCEVTNTTNPVKTEQVPTKFVGKQEETPPSIERLQEPPVEVLTPLKPTTEPAVEQPTPVKPPLLKPPPGFERVQPDSNAFTQLEELIKSSGQPVSYPVNQVMKSYLQQHYPYTPVFNRQPPYMMQPVPQYPYYPPNLQSLISGYYNPVNSQPYPCFNPQPAMPLPYPVPSYQPFNATIVPPNNASNVPLGHPSNAPLNNPNNIAPTAQPAAAERAVQTPTVVPSGPNCNVDVTRAMDQMSVSDGSSSIDGTNLPHRLVTKGVIGEQCIYVLLFRKKPHVIVDEVQELFFPAMRTVLELKRALRHNGNVTLDNVDLLKYPELRKELLSKGAIKPPTIHLDVVSLECLPEFVQFFGKYVPPFRNFHYVLEYYALGSSVWTS